MVEAARLAGLDTAANPTSNGAISHYSEEDPTTVTVAEIAHSWDFGNLGRFSQMYRPPRRPSPLTHAPRLTTLVVSGEESA